MPRHSLMKAIFIAAGISASGLPASAAPDPTGVWQRGDGNARVRIAPCGKDMCAINTWIRDPGDGEAIGDRLIMQLVPRTDSRLAGTAYDPKRGRTYEVTVTVGQGGLTTTGCILFGLLCRSVTWSRLPDAS
nr:DUF2147 domain-containing protein [uncultured Rhodopila sp.]